MYRTDGAVKNCHRKAVKNSSQISLQKWREYFREYFLLDIRDLKIFTEILTTLFGTF